MRGRGWFMLAALNTSSSGSINRLYFSSGSQVPCVWVVTVHQVRSEEWELGMLQEAVHQLVVHYDGCGTARRCFKVTPLTPPSVERQHPKSNRWCPSNLQRCFSHGWNGVRGNVVSNL